MIRALLRSVTDASVAEVELRPADAAHPDRFEARVNDEPMAVQIQSLGHGSGWMILRGEVVPFHVMQDGCLLQVWVRGRVCTFERVTNSARRSGEGVARAVQQRITAPMPGTVLKIHVEAGEAFEAHQPLIVMESMKMEMALSAPHRGVVREITCLVGDLVAMGAILVELERADGTA